MGRAASSAFPQQEVRGGRYVTRGYTGGVFALIVYAVLF